MAVPASWDAGVAHHPGHAGLRIDFHIAQVHGEAGTGAAGVEGSRGGERPSGLAGGFRDGRQRQLPAVAGVHGAAVAPLHLRSIGAHHLGGPLP